MDTAKMGLAAKGSFSWPRADILTALAVLCTGLFLYGLALLVRARLAFYKKVKQGMPMPKWNPIFGHLLVLNDLFKSIPPDIARPDIFTALSNEFSETDSLFYVDLWPFIPPLLLVSSPNYAIQACQTNDLGKSEALIPFLHPISGGNSLFTINGDEWKRGRALFSAGFGSAYILGQAHHVVDQAAVFVEILRGYAKTGCMFSLDDASLKYTMDISGAMTLNTNLNCQQKDNQLATAMRHTLGWHFMGELKSPIVRWSPLIRMIAWYDGYKMDKYISEVVEQRYAALRNDNNSSQASRSVLDLALEDYISSRKDKASKNLDPKFKKWLLVQLRLFFFVGHDSTSPTICYCYYMLSKNPSALKKLREEHDQVFGTDLSQLSTTLKEQPNLLNQLPYTVAVIKETLRLFPPASGFRAGMPEVYLEDDKGNKYPTSDTRIWVLHSALHRNPKFWPQPNNFLPERWLVGPEDPLYPLKGAWRPFEYGPRNCLGQNMAMLDFKITLVMTVREFEFRDAYEEWDQVNPSMRIKMFNGERAYQVGSGGAHPADGLPCFVSLRK